MLKSLRDYTLGKYWEGGTPREHMRFHSSGGPKEKTQRVLCGRRRKTRVRGASPAMGCAWKKICPQGGGPISKKEKNRAKGNEQAFVRGEKDITEGRPHRRIGTQSVEREREAKECLEGGARGGRKSPFFGCYGEGNHRKNEKRKARNCRQESVRLGFEKAEGSPIKGGPPTTEKGGGY